MSESSNSADARLAPLIEYFGERLNLAFAYFYFVLEFDGDEDLRADPARNARAWRLQTIENACIDAALIALRDLDDILSSRTSRKNSDDIRASDFGYEGSHTFLNHTEREKINKLVAHATTLGVIWQDFRWDILELATKGVSQCLEFLKWVENEYGLAHFNLYSAALVIRRTSESHLAYIRSETERRRSRGTGRPE